MWRWCNHSCHWWSFDTRLRHWLRTTHWCIRARSNHHRPDRIVLRRKHFRSNAQPCPSPHLWSKLVKLGWFGWNICTSSWPSSVARIWPSTIIRPNTSAGILGLLYNFSASVHGFTWPSANPGFCAISSNFWWTSWWGTHHRASFGPNSGTSFGTNSGTSFGTNSRTSFGNNSSTCGSVCSWAKFGAISCSWAFSCSWSGTKPNFSWWGMSRCRDNCLLDCWRSQGAVPAVLEGDVGW